MTGIHAGSRITRNQPWHVYGRIDLNNVLVGILLIEYDDFIKLESI